MSALGSHASATGFDEPSWLNSIDNVEACTPVQAAEFLNGVEQEDFGLFVLAHGAGMRLGEVAQTLKLDPALVVWRMRRALHRAKEEQPELSQAGLELAITDLLRKPSEGYEVPPPSQGANTGANTWALESLVDNLDEGVQQRLKARLEEPPDHTRSGIGVGVVALVLLAAAGFMVFGAIRDVNPLWRGKDLMQAGRFSEAQTAFAKYWDVVSAKEQIALCELALGDFDGALEAMAHPGVSEKFGGFAPSMEDIEPLDFDDESRALLPRGIVRNNRPTFVYRAGPAGRLHLRMGWNEEQVDHLIEIPDSRGGTGIVTMPYPRAWPSLPEDPVVWSLVPWVPGPEGTRTTGPVSQADFQVLGKERTQEFKSDARRFLTRSVPAKAHPFFLGNYLMRKGLYADAGGQFALLARSFPGAEYPRAMIRKIAAVLGVDPTAFLS